MLILVSRLRLLVFKKIFRQGDNRFPQSIFDIFQIASQALYPTFDHHQSLAKNFRFAGIRIQKSVGPRQKILDRVFDIGFGAFDVIGRIFGHVSRILKPGYDS
jgi:hypothetical protein